MQRTVQTGGERQTASWWDSEFGAALDDPPYACPRPTTRSLGAFLAVGYAVRNGVTRTTDLERLLMVTNEHDPAVDNDGAEALAAALETVAIDTEGRGPAEGH